MVVVVEMVKVVVGMEMVGVVVVVMLVTGDCVDGGGGELWWGW